MENISILNGYIGQVQRYYLPYIQRCVELGRLDQSEQLSKEMNDIIGDIQAQIKREVELIRQLSKLTTK